MNTGNLQGRTLMVTGASGTLGTAVARTCALAGATVVLLGRHIPKLEKLYDSIIADGGAVPAIYPMDLAGAGETDYHNLAATLEREMGSLHGLVHCAAELGHLAPLTDMDGQRWQRLLHINLTAPFLMTRELTPLLVSSVNAQVVFLGDSGVGDGRAYWGAYGVAKLGLAGYVRILAAELESFGVRASLFTPGPMRSPIRLRAYPGETPESLPCPSEAAGQLASLLANPHNT